MSLVSKIVLAGFLVALCAPVVWPVCDLWASGAFYRPGAGFFLADFPAFVALHGLAFYGARVLGVGFALAAVAAWARRGAVGGIDAKAWAFLLLALLIGPGLIANAGFKDHWGRARPREVTQFGGAAPFTPALQPHFDNARSNGSFVSGDGAFGFFLPTLAYVAPRRRSRRLFWGCMAAGGLFGLARLAMGAHFLSDIAFAALLMLAASAAVHVVMYGRRRTIDYWRLWSSDSTTD